MLTAAFYGVLSQGGHYQNTIAAAPFTAMGLVCLAPARRDAGTTRSPMSGITGLRPSPILIITHNLNDDKGEVR